MGPEFSVIEGIMLCVLSTICLFTAKQTNKQKIQKRKLSEHSLYSLILSFLSGELHPWTFSVIKNDFFFSINDTGILLFLVEH